MGRHLPQASPPRAAVMFIMGDADDSYDFGR